MKKMILTLAIALMGTAALAQSADVAACQASLDSLYEATLASKPSKEAKAEAKRLEKEGWKPQEGEKSIVEQIHESQAMGQSQMVGADGTQSARFLMQTAIQSSSSFATAYATARAKAQALLAGLIESKVTTAMETRLRNEQGPGATATSAMEFKQRVQSMVKQSLNGCIPVLCLTREHPGGLCEVQLRLAIDAKTLTATIDKASW